MADYAIDHGRCPPDATDALRILIERLNTQAYEPSTVRNLSRGNDEWGDPLEFDVRKRGMAIVSYAGRENSSSQLLGVVIDCSGRQVTEVSSAREIDELLAE